MYRRYPPACHCKSQRPCPAARPFGRARGATWSIDFAMPQRNMALSCALAALAAMTGCAGPSLWERHFVASMPGVQVSKEAPSKSAPPARVRRVPWERLQSTLQDLEQEAAASDAPIDEWAPEKRADADARLLRGLQVTAAPATVDVLGFSEFRTTQFGQPDEAELQTTARRVGADTVVWASEYLGKTDAVVERPVTTSTTWTNWYSRGRRTRTYTDTSTTFVPVRIQADQFAFVAFFLRSN